MIDILTVHLKTVSVHHIGNKTNGEDIQLSNSVLDVSDERIKDLLLQFFLTPFTNPEFYSFTFSNEDFALNAVYNFASEIFKAANTLHRRSTEIARHLYQLSTHPQIKSGDLFVAYFSQITMDDEVTDAIGIFKSENRQPFLKLNNSERDFLLEFDQGINVEKLDKGCLIFNSEMDTGYKVCVVDRSNQAEALYWKDSFLQLKPRSDDYHHTKDFMNLTKQYVAKQLSEDFQVSRADQIDLLNRSVDYFKTHEIFDKVEFENQVLQDQGIINSFQRFNTTYRQENEVDSADQFSISDQAVKKQARIFKSVLKLDKNFHIYIHGRRELIEQGVEKDGRKYYKIYFEQES